MGVDGDRVDVLIAARFLILARSLDDFIIVLACFIKGLGNLRSKLANTCSPPQWLLCGLLASREDGRTNFISKNSLNFLECLVSRFRVEVEEYNEIEERRAHEDEEELPRDRLYRLRSELNQDNDQDVLCHI